jgi:hypothetical protein
MCKEQKPGFSIREGVEDKDGETRLLVKDHHLDRVCTSLDRSQPDAG